MPWCSTRRTTARRPRPSSPRSPAGGFGGAKLWLTSQNLADYSQALPGGQLTGVSGILEGADSDAAFQAKLKAVDPGLGVVPVRAGGVRRDDPRGARRDARARRRRDPRRGSRCGRRPSAASSARATPNASTCSSTEPAIDYDGRQRRVQSRLPRAIRPRRATASSPTRPTTSSRASGSITRLKPARRPQVTVYNEVARQDVPRYRGIGRSVDTRSKHLVTCPKQGRD